MFGPLIKSYYYATRSFRDALFPTALILTYHRVAQVAEDPHQLSVTPANFIKQISYLKQHFNIISLKQLTADLKQRNLKRNSLVITFDDGYSDNLTNVLPILKELKVPATVFITTNKIDDTKPFYWDEQTNQNDQGRPMTLAELKELSASELIEIGSHTITHPHLTGLSIKDQQIEIEQSRQKLEDWLGRKIASFSYPFGECDSTVISLVKQAGYQTACALGIERVTNSSPFYALPRFLVRNWEIKEFIKQIKTFL